MQHQKRFWLVVALVATLLISAAAVSALAFSASGNIASGAQFDLYTVGLVAGEQVIATLVCDSDGVSRPLDPVLSVYFPGSDPSNTINADVYNDDGFGQDDDPNGVDCDAFDSSRVSFTAPVNGTYTFRADGFGSATGPYTLNIRSNDGALSADGRINPQPAAPIVMYCNGTSTHFFSVTGQDLGSVENGGSGTFGNAEVSETAFGMMQLSAPMNGGKTYFVLWDGCPSGRFAAYTIENGVMRQFANYTYGTNSGIGDK